MTKRKQYLFIAIWLAAITLMFVLWQYAFAQRRQISYQDWLPLVRQEKEPATPVKGIGLVYIDPNWNLTYKDIFERISVFAGPNITYNISNLAIDGNTIYIDGDNNSIGFFTTTPAAEAGIQYSDKFVICDTFTSAGVQACVDQLSTDGGQVILPEGDYLWSSRVYKGNTYHNIQIIGSGSGTCISPDPNNLWGYESGWKVGDYFNINGDNCSVSNLKFDGLNENAVTSSYLIYLGGDNCKVDRVHVYRCDPTNYGLISVDDYGQVTNCFFYYNRDGNAGINLEGNHSIASNNIFYDNLFYYGGIYSYWQRNISIINNIFYDEDDECIGIYGGYGSNISNNVMYNVKTGISCGYKAGSNASYNVTIKNNHIILAEAYGITLDAVQNFQIENNYIYDTDPNGIDILLGSTYYLCLSFFGSISGNYLSGIRDSSKNNSSDCGIKILGGSDFKINDNYIGYHKLYGIYAGPTSGGSYEQNQTRNIQISSNKINAQYGSNSFYTNSIYIDPNTENVSIWGNSIYDPNNAAPIVDNSTSHGNFDIYAQVGIETNPDDNAYLQISDKYIVCKTFTSTGINACIDALGSDGGEVYLPEGTYSLTTQIVIDANNTTIRGSGAGTILKLGFDGSAIYAIGLNNIVLDSFYLDCNDVSITSVYDYGIEISSSNKIIVQNCTFSDFENSALSLHMPSGADSSFAKVLNCNFLNSTDTTSSAIVSTDIISHGQTLYVSNCEFNNVDTGIYADYIRVIVTNCRFYNLSDQCVNITHSNGSSVTNCICFGCDAGEIVFSDSVGCILSGCTFYNSDGYSFSGVSSYSIITGNSFILPNDITGQIYLYTGCTDNVISNNTFKLEANDADYSIQFNGGDNTIICGNFFDTDVDIAAVYMDSSATGNICYGNYNLTISEAVTSPGVFEVAGPIRTYESEWYAADHHDMAGMDPGASGATWTDPSAGTTLGGMQLNAAGETLTFATDCHSDWDGASDIEIKVVFEVNVDNSGGDPNDTVDIKVISYFKGSEETTLKTQTNEVATVVGQSAQYKQWVATILIDYDDGSNPIDAGDKFRHILNLETDTSEVDDIIVNHIHSRYKTKQVHVEI